MPPTHKRRFEGEWVKLSDLCSKGSSSLRQKDLGNDGPYPVYGASGVVGTMAEYQNEKGYVGIVKDGAGIGRAFECSPKSSVLGTIQALLPKGDTNRDYLLHLVRSLDLAKSYSGSTIPHIYFKDYGKTLVKKTAIEEQEAIGGRFNKIDQLIQLQQNQLAKLDDFVKSRFIEMFGNPTEASVGNPLGSIAELKAGKTTAATAIYDHMEKGLFPCYGGNGLRGYVDKYTHDGTFPLIGRQGALCGNVQIANGKFRATEHAVVVQPFSGIDSEWLFYYLKFDNLGRLATGAAQPGLAVKNLNKILVDVPPQTAQRKFVDFSRKVDKLRFDVQQQIEKLETLKQSLMQEYFE